MEVYVCSGIRRHVLFVTLVLLAVVGNEPHRTVHAQVGTTKLRSATTLVAVAGGRTTVLPVRTTQQVYRATTQVAGQPYATTNRVTGAVGTTQRYTGAATAVAPQGTTPRAGSGTQAPGSGTQAPGAGTHAPGSGTQAPGGASTARPGGGGAVASTQRAVIASTQRPAGGSTQAPAGGVPDSVSSTTTATTASAAATTKETTTTQSITTQAESPAAGVNTTTQPGPPTWPKTTWPGTTRGATFSTASPSKINEFDIEYTFKIPSPLQGNENACVSESTKDLANTFGISTSRVTAVTCTQTGSDTIKVTARITPGVKPTAQDLENFKARSDYTTVRFNGWQNHIGEIVRTSFKYEKVIAPSSSQQKLLGLSETHWIMIGMGTVILLLFIVSITIICVGRRGGDNSRERMDEEASAASGTGSEEDEQPKKKWYSFLQRRKKGDDDSDGNRTDDESAYESAKGEDGSESDEESVKIPDEHKVV